MSSVHRCQLTMHTIARILHVLAPNSSSKPNSSSNFAVVLILTSMVRALLCPVVARPLPSACRRRSKVNVGSSSAKPDRNLCKALYVVSSAGSFPSAMRVPRCMVGLDLPFDLRRESRRGANGARITGCTVSEAMFWPSSEAVS
jgi:hypothetical protein